MKDLSGVLRVLEFLKKEFLQLEYRNYDCNGMCMYVQLSDELDEQDKEDYFKYYKRSKRGQKWFYTCENFKTIDRDQFGWHPYYPEFRLDWINHHIDRIESGKSLW